MEHHTWFYQLSDRTFQQAKELAKQEQIIIINDWSRPDKINSEAFNLYGWNKLTIEEALFYHRFLLDRINNDCEYTIWNNQPEHLSYYNPVTKKFYIDNGVAHDIIRVHYAPEIKFFSFDEMYDWIENNRNDKRYLTVTITESQLQNLREYWQAYPESMVRFA